MTVYVVSTFGRGPVAVFLDEGAARRFVLSKPGKFNAFQIDEFVMIMGA